MQSIEIISDFENFLRLKDDWNRVADAGSPGYVWMRHEWYESWWRAFGEQAKMFIVVAAGNDGPEAILPLMIRTMKIKGFRQRVLRFIENGITPRSGLISSQTCIGTIGRMWDEVMRHSSEWDLALLANLEAECDCYFAWKSDLDDHRVRYVELPERMSPYLELSHNWEHVWNTFGKNLRRNITRSKTRLLEQGVLSISEVTSAVQIKENLNDCYEISHAGWKGQRGSDMGGKIQRRHFYDLLTTTAIEQKWLAIWMLKLNNKPIAFEYTLIKDGYVLPMVADYDPEFKQFSPGTLLRSMILEEIARRGATTYDFGGTVYNYKLEWTKRIRPHSQFWIFHSGVKSRMLFQLKSRLLPAIARLKTGPAAGESEASDNG